MPIRLDKYLADNGIGTRSEVKKIIRSGIVSVNGAVVNDPDMKIEAGEASVVVSGKAVGYKAECWYMMNKPAGLVCANEDGKHKTVFDILDVPEKKRLFTVGRLDIDTEGLLLFTDNGEVSHSLLSPKKHVKKKYYLEYSGSLLPDAAELVKSGFRVDDELTAKPGLLELSGENSAFLTISEGKFHQVKRMIASLGGNVTFLKRISFGGIDLDEGLAIGEYRELTKEEILILKNRK